MSAVVKLVTAAPPPGACGDPEPASPTVTELPWAQKTLDVPAVHQHGTGAGVVATVTDSGVDADHPQLRQPGKVLRSEDFFLVGDLPGGFDCVSHGTGVASIIAAAPIGGVGFTGLAPDATILPVRVSKSDSTDGAAEGIDPEAFARGICRNRLAPPPGANSAPGCGRPDVSWPAAEGTGASRCPTGRQTYTLPCTASDHRSLRNAAHELAGLGVDLRRRNENRHRRETA
ncbi:S8 family serine peptidase [Amycolatopsis lurida]